MEVDTAAGGQKRSRDDSEQPSSPAADLKRRRFVSPEANDGTATRLGALASAISGVFGYSRPSQEPSIDPSESLDTNGSVYPPPPSTVAEPQPSIAKPPLPPPPAQPSPAPTTNSKSNGDTTQGALKPLPRIEIRLPASSSARPAIKMSALKGTKWDRAPVKKLTPKKPTPKPRGRKPAGIPMSASQPVSFSNIFDSTDVPESPSRSQPTSLNNTPTKANPFSAITPRGILSPTKKRGPRANKNVTFDSKGEVFFADLPKEPSAKKPRATPKRRRDDEEDTEIRCGICSKGHSRAPNEIILCDNCDFAAHQECYDVAEIPEGDWLCKSCTQEDVLKTTGDGVGETITQVEVPEIPNLDQHVRSLQRVLLDRCTGQRRIRMFGQDEAADKVRQVMEQTVLAGEGNSMLLIGQRGSGKTTLVENTISDLSQEHRQDFHVVRLNGFIHTDDKLALKEIWRQLGKEMAVEDDVLNRSNYADTMASLLALLSHPSEIMGQDDGMTSQAVIFIIDEFDMFATHPRQTLLYNLFDIAQSRKAPIAVLGCTTRLDVVEMLEKRVKSRFSHRYVYLSLPRSVPAYWQVCRQGLMLGEAETEGIDADLEGHSEFQKYWNHKIEDLYKQQAFQDVLQYHYYTTKSAAAFFSEWILPLSTLSATNLTLRIPPAKGGALSLAPPDSRIELLESLSELDLTLLIAAARLDIVAHTDTVNFAMAYDEYSSMVGRQRVQSATSGMLAVGGSARVWGRGVASMSWERLIALGFLVMSGLGGGRGAGGLEGRMWKVDVGLEELPTGVKLNNVMSRWCREI